MGREQRVHVAQGVDVRLLEFEVSLAHGDFVAVEPDLAGELVDKVVRDVHGLKRGIFTEG